MKKTIISLALVLALIVCTALALAPRAEATTQPCTGSHTGWTALPTTGGSLASGNYYLSASATLEATITIPADATVTICLSGNTLTAASAKRAITMANAGATLKICDCSGTNAGKIKGNGSVSGHGGVIYISNTTATVELYSGTITGGTTTGTGKHGGNVAVNKGHFVMNGGEITNGTASTSSGWGGNIYVTGNNTANETVGDLTIRGGVISGGSATGRGGNICVNAADLYLEAGSITGAQGNAGNNIQFCDNGWLNGTKLLDSLDAAVAAGDVTIDGIVYMGKWNEQTDRVEFFKLYSDIPSTYSVAYGNQDRYIDLNGHDFAGTLNVTSATTANKTLYLFDSATDTYIDANAGKYSGTIVNNTSYTIQEPTLGSGVGYMSDKHYLKAANSDGSYSYHRFHTYIEDVSIEMDADSVNVGYTASFKGGAAVAQAMQNGGEYGMKVYLVEDAVETGAKAATDFQANGNNYYAVRLSNVMTLDGTNNAAKALADIKAKPIIKINGVTIEGDEYALSFLEMVQTADSKLNDSDTPAALKELLVDIYEAYTADMKNWKIPNIKAEANVTIPTISAEAELALRQQVVQYMRQICTVEFALSDDYTYAYDNTTLAAGTAIKGMPYSHKAASLEKILSRIDSDGKLVLKSGETLDNIGNDCADAGFWAWSQISSGVTFTITNNAMCINGTYPVGDYDITGIPAVKTSSASVDGSKWVCNNNGTAVMYAAYAQLKMGDAVLLSPGHFRMVSANAVVEYNADGSIDGNHSYILAHEQGGYRYEDQEGYDWSSCTLHKQYSFATLYSTGYVPITMKAFTEGADREQVYVCNSSTANLQQMVSSGYVTSNYRINYITLTVKDSNDQVVATEQNFTFHGGSANTTVVALDVFADFVNGLSLTSGAEYTYQIDVHVGDATLTGQTVTFTA